MLKPIREKVMQLNKFVKQITVSCITACIIFGSANAQASSPFIFSPTWFKSLYQAYSENKDNVWRGKIINVIDPTTIVVKDELTGKNITVVLLHVYLPKGIHKQSIDLATSVLSGLINQQVYVLADKENDKVYAKILDANGKDLNLELIKNGYYDLNTTTLLWKKEKADYLAAVSLAQHSKSGVWYYSKRN